jgi:ATP-dependent Clp protease adaptor protein ClpS
MAIAETINDIDTVTKVALRPPQLFNVLIYNDDKTTMEFVVLILMTIFHKTFEEASSLTILIHELGSGVAGTYSFEIANQKRDDTVNAARFNSFPLKCEIKAA